MKRTFPICLAPVVGAAAFFYTQATFGSDVKRYTVEKGIQYVQTDPGAPIADSNNGAIFEADVKGSDTNLVTGVSILLPNGAGDTLPVDSPGEFKLKKKYDKQTGLDRNFPSGNYQLTVNTLHDGTRNLALSLVGDLYPNTPHLSNFAAAQALDSGAYFLFTWDGLTGGNSNDFVQLHIEDNQGNKVFETPDIGETGALDGRGTAALVPPRTFAAGQTYQAYIYFAKAVTHDTTTYPGAFGFSGYYKRTKASIQTAATASQAQVKVYGLSKTRRFQQDGSGAPVVQLTKTYNFEAFADTGTPGAVRSLSLVLPGGAVEPVPLTSDNKTFDEVQDFTSQSEFEGSYPNGTYGFRIVDPTGTKTPTLTLTGDAYPPAPHLSALPTEVNAGRDLSLSWDPFTGGTSTDFIQLHIDDDQGNKVFETPDYGKSGALDGTAVSGTIPHDTLLAGHSYSGRLVFQKNSVLDTASYPGALGLASYVSRTNFKLNAAAGGQGSLRLAVVPATTPGSFSLTIGGTPSQKVRIEGSIDLKQWADLGTNALSATGDFRFSEPESFTHRFYRAVTVP